MYDEISILNIEILSDGYATGQCDPVVIGSTKNHFIKKYCRLIRLGVTKDEDKQRKLKD